MPQTAATTGPDIGSAATATRPTRLDVTGSGPAAGSSSPVGSWTALGPTPGTTGPGRRALGPTVITFAAVGAVTAAIITRPGRAPGQKSTEETSASAGPTGESDSFLAMRTRC